MNKKTKIAHIIRIATIPPVLIFALLTILYFTKTEIYNSLTEYIISVILLMVIPTLAYPLAAIINKSKDDLRATQRKSAFILSLLGYTAAFLFGILSGVTKGLLLIYSSYFISIILLTFINKVLQIKASGHACSITGPLLLTVYFVGYIWIFACLLLFTLIVWSSLILKRHSLKELLIGTSPAIIAFSLSLLFITVII